MRYLFETGDRVCFRSPIDRSCGIGTVVSVSERTVGQNVNVLWDDPRDNDEGYEDDPTYVMEYTNQWLHPATPKE